MIRTRQHVRPATARSEAAPTLLGVSAVLHEHVEDALRELADEREQRRLWLADSGGVSSLDEATCHLFNDSGLADALAKPGSVYSWAIDNGLRLLRDLLRSVNANLPVEELLATPALVPVQTVAAALLIDLNSLRYATDE